MLKGTITHSTKTKIIYVFIVRYKPLIELLCSYHWMIAYVDMNIIDELISNFLYVVPLIPIVK